MDLIVHNEEEMLQLGQTLAAVLGPSDIIYLRGYWEPVKPFWSGA